MHIILAVLGAVVTILILVNRAQENGLDLGWLNPFSWFRRRKYRVNHDLNPAFKLESPLECVSLLMLCMAKSDGDISKEQKSTILSLFDSEFHLSSKQATELLASSAYLFGNGVELLAKPEAILDRSIGNFSPEQLQSMTTLMDKVAHAEGEPTPAQRAIFRKVQACLPKTGEKWQ
ncbi:MAG: TerB family tellurite resistance protein [Algicola sp.]|nr:TerB family tellurite resistance protein [Algicola sp.]